MTLLSKASIIATPTAYGDGVLNSVKPTDGAGDFDFARASSATRVNEQGLIEKERENLLLQSNSFDTTWANVNTTETSGQSGYDGSSDAWLIDITAAGGFIYQSVSQSGVQTFSCYAKAGSVNFLRILGITSGTNPYAYFNISTGTISVANSACIDASIDDIGSGWYRCSITFSDTISQVRFYPAIASEDLTATSGNIYIQDAQLEQGLVATEYIETTTSSVAVGITNDIPRINYENGIGNFLLEPQRTNLVTDSEYFDIYTKSNATITDNDSTSPEGVDNAASLAGNGASTSHYIYRNYGSATSGTSYTFSFFAKKGSLNYVQFVAGSGAFGVLHQNYDLENGVLGSSSGSVDSFIEDYGNGWYRVGTTITATASTTIVPFIALANSSTMSRLASFATSNDVKIYGLQIEAGYLTSYIPTYGSAVTRAAETCNNAGNSDLFNDSEGVLYAEVAYLKDRGTSSPFKVERISVSDGTDFNRIFISNTTTANQIQVFVRNATGISFNQTITISDVTIFNKIALKYKANDFSLWINGSELATDTTYNYVPPGLDVLKFEGASGAYDFEGKTKMVSTFTEALSDSELECLTSWSSFERMATAQNYTIQ